MGRNNEIMVLDRMASVGSWAVLGNDTINFALSNTSGFGGLKFDKTNGTDNTVYAGISRAAGIDLSGWQIEDKLVWLCNPGAKTGLVASFIRLGASATSYVEWSYPADKLAANRMNLCAVPFSDGAATGLGITNVNNIQYMAVGFQFGTETDALANVVIGQIGLRASPLAQNEAGTIATAIAGATIATGATAQLVAASTPCKYVQLCAPDAAGVAENTAPVYAGASGADEDNKYTITQNDFAGVTMWIDDASKIYVYSAAAQKIKYLIFA